MSETTLINHESRITRIEDTLASFAGQMEERVKRLEDIFEQSRVDKEQENRMKNANTVQELENVRRELEELKGKK